MKYEVSDIELALIENIVKNDDFSLINSDEDLNNTRPEFLVALLADAIKNEAVEVICGLAYYKSHQTSDSAESDKQSILIEAATNIEDLFDQSRFTEIYNYLDDLFNQNVPDALCAKISGYMVESMSDDSQVVLQSTILGDKYEAHLVEAC